LNIFEFYCGETHSDQTQKVVVDATRREIFYEPQSTPIDAVIKTDEGTVGRENITFLDGDTQTMYDLKTDVDPTKMLLDADQAPLADFFARPVKIREFTWNVGSGLNVSFDPWAEFFDNPRVSNRICNYNLLRCNLVAKVVINGNAFHYGRLVMSYLPLEGDDDISVISGSVANIVQATQLPHVYLDPTTSTGGELRLPYFWYTNYFRIPQRDWIGSGKLYIRAINNLKHANGATDKVSISVFVHAEDVQLSVLTSQEPFDMLPQSEMEEVNDKGIVSGPATAVANIAGRLSDVPYIGKFAKATNLAASATAAIAKLYGFSRPTETKAPGPFRPAPISSLAVTNTGDTSAKLTVDAMQELTVDPRTAGVGTQDDLAITSIATRESYITQFPWATTATTETLLWNTRVSPVTWNIDNVTGAYLFPACAAAAIPFKFWSGTMKYRFQFITSNYHKGRVKIVFDPQYVKTNEYNTNYMYVVDLAETNDFTVTVGNGQPHTLLGHAYPGVTPLTDVYRTTPFTDFEYLDGNGTLSVYVVNELTTPNSTVDNNIEVNVYVSAGDDFEVYVPTYEFSKFVIFPQSDMEPQSMLYQHTDMTKGKDTNMPVSTEVYHLGVPAKKSEYTNMVFTGEKITSFRQMLKRYYAHSALAALTSSSDLWGRRNMFPYFRGRVTGAVDSIAVGNYNFCNTVMLHWVTLMFAAWRGSIRYKFIPYGMSDERDSFDGFVERASTYSGDDEFIRDTAAQVAFTNSTASASLIRPSGNSTTQGFLVDGSPGAHFVNGRVNPNVEFEMPYYAPNRFSPAKLENLTGAVLDYNQSCFDYHFKVKSNANSLITIFVSAGEDYTCFFFTGLPPLHYEAAPPAPV